MGKAPTSDPGVTPAELTGLREEAANATSGCCTCTYRKDGTHGSSGKVQQLRADGVTPNGQTDTRFKAEIFIDGDGGKVSVLSRWQAFNRTADTTNYPGTVQVTDADLATKLARIPPAVQRAWNRKPYKLRITDDKCGERVFTVKFFVQMVSSAAHWSVNFVNVAGMGTQNDVVGLRSGRSYIQPGSFAGKFNLGDSRSATDTDGDDRLEPHEFGHMIGLKDEYHDVPLDRGGCTYTFFDNSTETVGANNELMGNMTQTTARPVRYCITIAYAVVAILTENGHTVTAMEIE
jgi:hypothetical protein